MAGSPKLSIEQWASVRARWEADPRGGYTWLVEEMSLPVSVPAVRKTALRDGWCKKTLLTPTVKKPTAKVSGAKVSKVSQTIRETMGETIRETMGEGKTMAPPGVEVDPDQFGVFADLSDQQEIFVREYLVDWNASAAAIRAGYSAKSAMTQGWQLLQNSKVSQAITTLASARARRLGIDGDELMRLWAAIIAFDANEISQLRRVCCPYCQGQGHHRQYTPAGLQEAREKHERERERRKKADEDDDIGEFPEYTDAWYDKRKDPHENCPECHGQGIEEVFYSDTRKLSPAARLVYCGVRMGKDNIEVLMLSREKVMDNIARALGMFKDKDVQVSVNMVSGQDLYHLYEEKMHQARTRQAAVWAERGLTEAPQGPQEPQEPLIADN